MFIDWLIYFVEFVFALSMIFNSLLYIPQAIAIYKTKDSKGVSAATFVGFNIVQIFTMLHACVNNDRILLYGNVLSFILCGIVTFLIFYYDRTNKKAAAKAIEIETVA
jgi:MtN3 and saliva related transmembrane protein